MTMLRFQCSNCGFKIKAPDEYAGRKGKCPKCHQTVSIPTSSQQKLDLLNVATGSKTQKKPTDNIKPVTGQEQTNQDSQNTKNCPYCGETILAVAIKCKHCNEFLDGFSKPQASTGKSETDTLQLQQEYYSLQEERKRYNRLSFIFGLPGIVLLIIVNVIFFQNLSVNSPPSSIGVRLFALASLISLSVGLGYYAKYKGRSPWIGLLGLLTIIGLIALLCFRDYNKERMIQIAANLRARGQTHVGSYALEGVVKTSGLAKASLILSFVGFPIGIVLKLPHVWILSIIGMVIASFSLLKMKSY